jgi:hypothetical protein
MHHIPLDPILDHDLLHQYPIQLILNRFLIHNMLQCVRCELPTSMKPPSSPSFIACSVGSFRTLSFIDVVVVVVVVVVDNVAVPLLVAVAAFDFVFGVATLDSDACVEIAPFDDTTFFGGISIGIWGGGVKCVKRRKGTGDMPSTSQAFLHFV